MNVWAAARDSLLEIGWTTGTSMNPDGSACIIGHVGRACGAVRTGNYLKIWWRLPYDVRRALVLACGGRVGPQGEALSSSVWMWNDGFAKSIDDVYAKLELAQKIHESEMA